MLKVGLFLLSTLCFLHIIRDFLQIKNGYNTWFTKVGHFWHAPQYEMHGVVIFFFLGLTFLYIGLNQQN